MITRALSALAFLLGGCTIHVVEQPATPVAVGAAPAVVVAEQPAPRPRPVRVSHVRHEPRPQPVAVAPRPQPDPRKPSRADMTPLRPAQPSKPLYTPFRDVGSGAVTTSEPAPPTRIKKVKKAGT